MRDKQFKNDLIRLSLFIKKQDKILLRFPVLFIQHMGLFNLNIVFQLLADI